jgi:hypothetical protein
MGIIGSFLVSNFSLGLLTLRLPHVPGRLNYTGKQWLQRLSVAGPHLPSHPARTPDND